jgi:uncharacterized membrane protein YtjA (UPF0391 family)
MLGWAIAFITAAVIVGLLGVAETANTFGALTRVLFWVFLVGFLVSLAMHWKSLRTHGNHR